MPVLLTLIAVLLGALVYYDAPPSWTSLRDFVARVIAVHKAPLSWRSIGGAIVAFALASALLASVVAPSYDGSRESVYKAVRAFQAQHELVVDGVVGPKTFAILYPR